MASPRRSSEAPRTSPQFERVDGDGEAQIVLGSCGDRFVVAIASSCCCGVTP